MQHYTRLAWNNRCAATFARQCSNKKMEQAYQALAAYNDKLATEAGEAKPASAFTVQPQKQFSNGI